MTPTPDGGKIEFVGGDPQTELMSEIAALRGSIDRAAAATEIVLAGHPPEAEHQELCRQLAVLRERVARAQHRDDDPSAVRAELATLLFFAKTLEADIERWRSALANR